MIRHIVMFRLTKEVTEENRNEILKKIATSAANMVGKIPGLVTSEMVTDIGTGTHDIALVCTLEKAEDVPVYQGHPAHLAHKELTKDWVMDRAVIDYEL